MKGHNLSTWDYGTGEPQALFLAANGFPVRSYDFMLQPLAREVPLTALESRGAVPGVGQPPKRFGWQDHARDLLAALEQLALTIPPVGIGHSIGATVTALAAQQRPAAFRGLVLIDPATIPGRVLPLTARLVPGLTKRMPLVKSTRNRRVHWPSREAFASYLSGKLAYKHFTAQAMRDYAEAGLVERDGRLELAYSRDWEAWNFQNTTPLWPALKGLSMPVLILRGERSYLHPNRDFRRHTRRLPGNFSVQTITGAGHMLPQEAPEQVLIAIADWCRQQGF